MQIVGTKPVIISGKHASHFCFMITVILTAYFLNHVNQGEGWWKYLISGKRNLFTRIKWCFSCRRCSDYLITQVLIYGVSKTCHGKNSWHYWRLVYLSQAWLDVLLPHTQARDLILDIALLGLHGAKMRTLYILKWCGVPKTTHKWRLPRALQPKRDIQWSVAIGIKVWSICSSNYGKACTTHLRGSLAADASERKSGSPLLHCRRQQPEI